MVRVAWLTPPCYGLALRTLYAPCFGSQESRRSQTEALSNDHVPQIEIIPDAGNASLFSRDCRRRSDGEDTANQLPAKAVNADVGH